MRSTRFQRVVSAIERIPFDARTHLIGLFALIAYCVGQAVFQPTLAAWDWHKISALALLLIGIRVAARIDDLLSHALRRLCVRGIIACSRDEFERLNEVLALRRRKFAPVWGLTIGLAIVMAFLAGWDWDVIDKPWRLALLAVEAPMFYVAGYYIGWMVVQGRLARVLKTLGITYSVQPGHPDGAAGLRPLGDFFFRQAMLAGLPAAYVVFWIVLQPPVVASLILLPLFLFVEVAAFVWPIWAFHRVMVCQKRSLVTQADEIARRISSTQAKLRGPIDSASIKELDVRLSADLQLYEEMASLSTWPVSKKIRRRFALQNLALVALPVLSGLVGGKGTGFIERLLEIFGVR